MPLTVCRAAVLLFVGCASLSLAGPPVSPTEPMTPAEQKAKFKLPAGFARRATRREFRALQFASRWC